MKIDKDKTAIYAAAQLLNMGFTLEQVAGSLAKDAVLEMAAALKGEASQASTKQAKRISFNPLSWAGIDKIKR
jgi:hypothetical protein